MNRNEFEYKMSKEMAKAYLDEKKGTDELKMNTQNYLRYIVNTEFGIKGDCIRVIVD